MLESKIFSHLSTSTAIGVSARIYPVRLPQEPTYPAITYQRISGGQENSFGGYATLENPRMQIDVWADTYLAAKNAAEAVHTAMNGATAYRATLISDSDLYESDIEIYRVSMDFSCWNKE